MTVNTNTCVVRIESIERLNNSVNGNPRFRLHTDTGGVFTTQSDSMIGYQITNLFESSTATDLKGKPVALFLTRAGRVWDIQAV